MMVGAFVFATLVSIFVTRKGKVNVWSFGFYVFAYFAIKYVIEFLFGGINVWY
ncbi:gp25 [Listeria phage P40]|uniref:gp25 n=1 Tax=Listeria phage P40 TaxID=560178 RepID=UPI00018198DF|nr:gp25 [Listeria phage P40]ACI00385.1 gp25 [Listeria phage P40]